ncbi:Uncharacterized protein Fot_51769 [Forsythia ovata]|uniref:Uncharacterized protein n=1 Tax=Forsythia ovata TaxID=205694 RepID=A0ABD1PWD5_9LAMI
MRHPQLILFSKCKFQTIFLTRRINGSLRRMVKADSFESISGQSGGKYDYREPKNRFAEKVGKHRIIRSRKDGSVDRGDGARSRGKKIPASFKADSDNSDDETVSKGAIDHSSLKKACNLNQWMTASCIPESQFPNFSYLL